MALDWAAILSGVEEGIGTGLQGYQQTVAAKRAEDLARLNLLTGMMAPPEAAERAFTQYVAPDALTALLGGKPRMATADFGAAYRQGLAHQAEEGALKRQLQMIMAGRYGLELTGEDDAAKEGQGPEGDLDEHPGVEGVRPTAEAGGGDRAILGTQDPQAPPALAPPISGPAMAPVAAVPGLPAPPPPTALPPPPAIAPGLPAPPSAADIAALQAFLATQEPAQEPAPPAPAVPAEAPRQPYGPPIEAMPPPPAPARAAKPEAAAPAPAAPAPAKAEPEIILPPPYRAIGKGVREPMISGAQAERIRELQRTTGRPLTVDFTSLSKMDANKKIQALERLAPRKEFAIIQGVAGPGEVALDERGKAISWRPVPGVPPRAPEVKRTVETPDFDVGRMMVQGYDEKGNKVGGPVRGKAIDFDFTEVNDGKTMYRVGTYSGDTSGKIRVRITVGPFVPNTRPVEVYNYASGKVERYLEDPMGKRVGKATAVKDIPPEQPVAPDRMTTMSKPDLESAYDRSMREAFAAEAETPAHPEKEPEKARHFRARAKEFKDELNRRKGAPKPKASALPGVQDPEIFALLASRYLG